MKYRILHLLFFLIACLISSESFAQRSISQYRGRRVPFAKNLKYFSVGGSVNALNYFGDLAPKGHIASTKIAYTRPGFGITGTYRIGPQSSVRSSFIWGRLKGDDFSADPLGEDSRYRYMRNLHFRNDIKELSVDYIFDLVPHFRTFITRPRVVPYLFVGVAVFHHNPKAKLPAADFVHAEDLTNPFYIQENDPRYAGVSPGEWIALKPLGTEGQYIDGSGVKPYSNWQIAIPFGAGVRYQLSRYFDLSFEISYRQTFTDYLDDVSGYYVNPEDFGTGPQANLSRLLADRSKEAVAVVSGNARRPETYLANGLHGTYPGQVPAEFGSHNYKPIRGFGHDGLDQNRGRDDWDVYLVTKVQLTYIIGTNIRNAKFR